MRIALVDTSPKQRVDPVSLLKLGAWRKGCGDDCEVFRNTLPPAGAFDEIWLTTCFSFDMPHALGMVRAAKQRASRVWVGGISASLFPEPYRKEGVDVHVGLLPEAEACSPDYSLLGEVPEYSITHTTRGCIRKCGFCMVTKLEPRYSKRDGWENDVHPESSYIRFYDNNWLAKSPKALRRDAETIARLCDRGIKSVDFNQGLDCRLLTDEKLDAIKDIPIRPVRFAFDNMEEDGHYQSAIRRMAGAGFTSFSTYVLYNFNDTPPDLWHRLRASAELSEETGARVQSFPMRYAPITAIRVRRDHVGQHWRQGKRLACSRFFYAISPSGQLNLRTIAEFEYWFGASPQEFARLLRYPQLLKLLRMKKGQARWAPSANRMGRNGPN
jgi:hypothetical protein